MEKRYAELFADLEASVTYWATVPLIEFSRSLSVLMRARGINRAELARRIGVSRAYVTKVLSGDENLTASNMAKFAMAVQGVVHIQVAAREAMGLANGEAASFEYEKATPPPERIRADTSVSGKPAVQAVEYS